MQLSLIPRNYDQSWLLTFLQTIKEKIQTFGNDFLYQEEINKTMLQDLPTFAATALNQDNTVALEDITIIREKISKILVKNILIDYLHALKLNNVLFDTDLKIAFDFYGNGILVWVEPNEKDKDLEDKLLEIEKGINLKYSKQQIEMKTVVFDKSYGFEFPPQYV